MSTVAELGYAGLKEYEIAFPNLGIQLEIDPTAFTLFGVDIKWYGLLITFGMLLALVYGFRNMVRVGIDPDRAIDAVIGGIIGGIVGARLYYVIFNFHEFEGDLLSIFNTRTGGLAIYGGVIGALLVGGIVAKCRKVRIFPMLDVVGVGFLIGQGIGRWGNFVNQEAFGSNTNNLLCMTGGTIQGYMEKPDFNPAYPVHPCFLYESVWCLLGFVLLAVISRKWRKFDGQIFLLYIGWYGLGRFFIEGLRTDSLMIGTLRVSQVLAALCVVFSVIMLLVCGSKVKRLGRDYVLYCNSKESKELLAQAEERAEQAYQRKMAKKTETEALKPEQQIVPDEEKQEDEHNGKID